MSFVVGEDPSQQDWISEHGGFLDEVFKIREPLTSSQKVNVVGLVTLYPLDLGIYLCFIMMGVVHFYLLHSYFLFRHLCYRMCALPENAVMGILCKITGNIIKLDVHLPEFFLALSCYLLSNLLFEGFIALAFPDLISKRDQYILQLQRCFP